MTVNVERHAADWLRKNMPLHWALPMFDPNEMKKILDEQGKPDQPGPA